MTLITRALSDVEMTALSANPLLASVSAETLRVNVHTFTLLSAPHEDLTLGKHLFPRGNLGIVNSHPAHADSDTWNTRGGKHPLHTFLSNQFIVNPGDPSSGPSKLSQPKPLGKNAAESLRDRDLQQTMV